MLLVILLVGTATFALWKYLSLRLLSDLSLSDFDQQIATGIAIFSLIAVPLGLLATTLPRKTPLRVFTLPGLFLIGLLSTLLVLTVLRDFGLAIYYTIASSPLPGVLRWSAQWTIISSFILTFVGYVNAKATPRLKEFDFPISGLRTGMRGFRVAHLTDVHVGPTIGAKTLQAMVDAINSKNPDVVVITGDLVDGKLSDLMESIAPLFSLKSVYGTFFVTGNHEYYSGCAEWISHLKANGVTVLLNEHRVITHMGARLAIAGVTDHKAHHFIPSHRCDPHAALHGIAAGTPTILLAHQPVTAQNVPSEKVSLQLSGHTHGGQFFPWIFAVPLQQPVVSGLSNKYKHPVYVSRGAGYWGPPKRIAAQSEIAIITLVPHDE